MTWEGVPSIRVVLEDSLAGGAGGGGAGGGGGSGSGSSGQGQKGVTARTATLLKHPARVIIGTIIIYLFCGYQVVSPRSYRLIMTIILQGHPGSSGAL